MDRVLEIGAGTGIFSMPIARLCHELVAVDVSKGMLAVLEHKAADCTSKIYNVSPEIL